jgi:outer membrane protein OmpA-like peptidoglycan-associated protein
MKFSTKKAITLLSAMGFMLCAPLANAQEGENLVPNGSFESIGKKPKRLGKIESATGWVSPTGVRADLFVDTKIEEISVPDNIYGRETAHEGENYAGLTGFSYNNKVPRSYMMTKLESPMKKGMTYCVKMYVSLSEASKYASNNVGVHFSKKALGTDAKVSMILEPSVVHRENDYETMSARFDWTEVCGVYVAKGGEKYIALGNFSSNEDTRYERMKKDNGTKDIKVQQVVAAYYYVDDVSVYLLDQDKGETCDCASGEEGVAYSTLIYQKVFPETDETTPKQRVEMQQIYFAFGKQSITTEGERSLNIIVDYLKANPSANIQIKGYCNKKENEVGAENDIYADMDNQRIGSVMKFLMEKGIDEGRIIPSRKRDDSPNTEEYSDADDEEVKQAKDRRVTFVLR